MTCKTRIKITFTIITIIIIIIRNIVSMTCETRIAIIIHHPEHELSPPMLIHWGGGLHHLLWWGEGEKIKNIFNFHQYFPIFSKSIFRRCTQFISAPIASVEPQIGCRPGALIPKPYLLCNPSQQCGFLTFHNFVFVVGILHKHTLSINIYIFGLI